MYWNRSGEEITVMEWVELFRDRSYRFIAKSKDQALHGRLVSTVWLGIWHGDSEAGPLIFETMVFDKDGNILDQRRTATEEDAKIMHAEMCAKWELQDSTAREIYDEL